MPLGDVEVGATVRIVRFENEAEDLLHYLKDAGIEPGEEGTIAEKDDDHIVVDFGGRSVGAHALRGRDGVRHRGPVAAAAHGAARAARALQGPLRPLSRSAQPATRRDAAGGRVELPVGAERDEVAQPRHGVVNVDVPGVERRDAKSHGVRAAEVGDDAARARSARG